MRARSRLTTIAIALLSMLVVGVGLAWACTPAEGGVDETSGKPGSQTTFTGRYFAPNEPVEVRWNEAYENSDSAPLLTTAQADDNGVLGFTVTIPQDEPGAYWIVVRGPGGQTSASGQTGSMRAQAEYTIEGAAAPAEPEEAPPAEEEPEASTEPRPSGNSSPGDGREPGASADRSTETSAFGGTPLRQNDLAAAASSISPSRDRVPGRLGEKDPARLPADALRHDPPMAEVPPWNAVTEEGDANRAPSLVPVTNAGAGPLSQFAVGAALLGVGLVAMFAGFFVAEIRRQRKAEATLERDPNQLSS